MCVCVSEEDRDGEGEDFQELSCHGTHRYITKSINTSSEKTEDVLVMDFIMQEV